MTSAKMTPLELLNSRPMPLAVLMGVKFIEAEKDRVVATMVVREDLCTMNHVVHGGTAAENAEVVRSVVAGVKGPIRDIVCLNAAAGFVVADRSPDLASGLELARSALDSGAAANALERMVEVSHRA